MAYILRNLIGIPGCCSIITRANNSLAEFPTGDRSAGECKCFADLVGLRIGRGNFIARHIHESYCNSRVPVFGIVEDQYIIAFNSAKRKRLLRSVREIFLPCQFRMGRVQRIIVNRFRRLNNGQRVARDPGNRSGIRDRYCSAFNVVVYRISGCFRLLGIYKGNNIFCFEAEYD